MTREEHQSDREREARNRLENLERRWSTSPITYLVLLLVLAIIGLVVYL